MHETGCSGLVHWDDPEGWDGERDGSGVQNGEHMYTRGVTIFYYIKKLEKIKIKYASYEIQLSSWILHFSLDCLIYVQSKLEWMARTNAVDEERANIF